MCKWSLLTHAILLEAVQFVAIAINVIELIKPISTVEILVAGIALPQIRMLP
jgi:hypothetical protein